MVYDIIFFGVIFFKGALYTEYTYQHVGEEVDSGA